MAATKLDLRLGWAKLGVEYVENGCSVVSSNRGLGEWLGGVVTFRGLRLAAQRAGYPDLPGNDLADVAANSAKQTQLGNCYEKSALAYQFLKSRAQQIGPINWCAVTGHVTGHGIVILGMLQGFCSDVAARPERCNARKDGSWGVQNTNPATWPRDAVVCDPWNRVAYPISEWESREHGRYVEVCATSG